MKYEIGQIEVDVMPALTGCTNPTEKCPACPRWMKDCDGLDEYNEILENVDCGWK